MSKASAHSLKSFSTERSVGASEKPSEAKEISLKKSSTTPPPDKSPQYGRRAGRHSQGDGNGDDSAAKNGIQSNWFKEVDKVYTPPPKDTYAKNVPTIADGEDDQTHREEQRRMQEQREKFAKKVIEMPTNYQAPMPSLKDLDIHCNWDRLLQNIHSVFDMSCLTTCLSRELDEDITWNPEMLLVQLSSDMRDAAEVKANDEAIFVPADAQEVGLMSGGEVIRKRREKELPVKRETEAALPPEKDEKRRPVQEGSLFSNPPKRSESINTKGSESSRQDGRRSPNSGKPRRPSRGPPGKTAPKTVSPQNRKPSKSPSQGR
ncbi:unnamed protein product [Phytomonas sp. EM1]|nr:unnamed protein product [Phytomonas sp. EM1]|eukprot:CCW63646.1 unnamed protein product [Phytomonas sp. isolate EM1]